MVPKSSKFHRIANKSCSSSDHIYISGNMAELIIAHALIKMSLQLPVLACESSAEYNLHLLLLVGENAEKEDWPKKEGGKTERATESN